MLAAPESLLRVNKMRRLLVLPLLAALFAGCASHPTSVVLGPQIRPGQCCANESVSLDVVDARVNSALLVLIEDGKRKDVPAYSDVAESMAGFIRDGLQQRGIATTGGNTLKVEIQQLGATVSSGLLKHDTTVNAQLRFVVETANGTVTRAFSGQRSDTKPKRPDVAAIEKEMNLLLGRVLTEALDDPQLLEAIKDSAPAALVVEPILPL